MTRYSLHLDVSQRLSELTQVIRCQLNISSAEVLIQRCSLLLQGKAVAEAQSHAAKANCGNFEAAFSKFASLHGSFFFLLLRRGGHVDLRDVVSLTKRYSTSDLSSRANASLRPQSVVNMM